MNEHLHDHYATLGVSRDGTKDDIKAAYRALAKKHHPDVMGLSSAEKNYIHAINAAYAVLGDEAKRLAYDRELAASDAASTARSFRSVPSTIKQDAFLGFREFIDGAQLDVVVRDPAHPPGVETYSVEIPAETAPGTRFRIQRESPTASGWIVVRVKARPDRQFKVKGSDVKYDLRINARRAASGGQEMLRGVTGRPIRVDIPAKIARGETIRVPGEGLPKSRGGRGDLLVRVLYRPEVFITRARERHGPSSANPRQPRRRIGIGRASNKPL